MNKVNITLYFENGLIEEIESSVENFGSISKNSENKFLITYKNGESKFYYEVESFSLFID